MNQYGGTTSVRIVVLKVPIDSLEGGRIMSFIRQYVYWGQTANFCSSSYDVAWMMAEIHHRQEYSPVLVDQFPVLKLLDSSQSGGDLTTIATSNDAFAGSPISSRQTTNYIITFNRLLRKKATRRD